MIIGRQFVRVEKATFGYWTTPMLEQLEVLLGLIPEALSNQNNVRSWDNDILCWWCFLCFLVIQPISMDLCHFKFTFISIGQVQIAGLNRKTSKFVVDSAHIGPGSLPEDIRAPLLIEIESQFEWPHRVVTRSLEVAELCAALVDPRSRSSSIFPIITHLDTWQR